MRRNLSNARLPRGTASLLPLPVEVNSPSSSSSSYSLTHRTAPASPLPSTCISYTYLSTPYTHATPRQTSLGITHVTLRYLVPRPAARFLNYSQTTAAFCSNTPRVSGSSLPLPWPPLVHPVYISHGATRQVIIVVPRHYVPSRVTYLFIPYLILPYSSKSRRLTVTKSDIRSSLILSHPLSSSFSHSLSLYLYIYISLSLGLIVFAVHISRRIHPEPSQVETSLERERDALKRYGLRRACSAAFDRGSFRRFAMQKETPRIVLDLLVINLTRRS